MQSPTRTNVKLALGILTPYFNVTRLLVFDAQFILPSTLSLTFTR